MNKLIKFELKRNRLKTYHIAVVIITVVILSFLYLLAAIPQIDAADSDTEMFMSYDFIIGLGNIISMAVFSIMSSVMASKFIVDEYTGKKAILLFCYPVDRKKILDAKIIIVLFYTAISMLVCNGIATTVFLSTESLFPLCQDSIDIMLIWNCIFSVLCYSLMSALVSLAAVWLGFMKKSIIVTITSACVIVSILCQIIGMTLFIRPVITAILAVILMIAIAVWINLHSQVEKMEV
ncbi:MAG: ABC transporter permease subunit [Lachnospiraceae bacterium]|nr:ABC transporter permease subunit [Lachnospiraceae bacterium]